MALLAHAFVASDASGVGDDIATRKIGQRCFQEQIIAAAAASPMKERDHPRSGQSCQVMRGRQCGCGYAEEGNEYAVLAAHVLIGRVPEKSAGAHVAHAGAKFALEEHGVGVALTIAADDPFERGIAVPAVHAGEAHAALFDEQAACQFKMGKMRPGQEHATTFRAGRSQVLQTLNAGRHAQDCLPCAHPGQGEFDQHETDVAQAFVEQAGAFAFTEFGKAQCDIACGDLPARSGNMREQPAEASTDTHQPGIGDAREQPEQTETDPCRPVRGAEQGQAKRGQVGAHPRIMASGPVSAYAAYTARPAISRPSPNRAAPALHPDHVPADASHSVPAGGTWPALSALSVALARALRLLSGARIQRKQLGARGVGWRGECSRAAHRGADAQISRRAHGGDHGDPHRFGAGTEIVRRSRVPCLPALRPARIGQAFPRSGPAALRGDHGNRYLAEPVSSPVANARFRLW